MKKQNLVLTAAALGCMLHSTVAAGERCSLEMYLARVATANPAIASAALSAEALRQKTLEMDMVYSPYITGGYSYTDDRSGASFGSSLPTESMRVNAWNIAVAKKFAFGSTVTAGYGYSDAALTLLSPVAIVGSTPVSGFTGYDMKPYIKAEQSLLRDFNAGLTKAGIDKTKAAARAAQYLQEFKRQQILLQAQTAYWALVLAREVEAFRKVSLERTAKLLAWNENRVRLDLADRSDLLQAQAAYKLRQLNYQLATEDTVTAARAFNECIGVPGAAVTDDLDTLADNTPRGGELPHTGHRADVLAAREQFASSKFAEQETKYRSLPELSVSGLYSLHGLELNAADAWSQVAGFEKPTYMLGLSFIVPLDYATLKNVRAGYTRDFEAARATLQAAELAERNAWEQLTVTWNNIQARLALATDIKRIQEERLAHEAERYKRGRTTTFQLLTAESDLDDATLNVYRQVFEAIITCAQAQLYSTHDQGGN